ncbi:ABC transporter B family member 29, chloroplastic-like [Pistacia vera]|uniref:ABC transporter B family member 29, chloroplastic-like n=1 Tax=Pistacia vera TaxID=55513 RepID=UPI001262F00B|nr:ABC transporter B family member 29, chloroplastic-like [Pistacia vera]
MPISVSLLPETPLPFPRSHFFKLKLKSSPSKIHLPLTCKASLKPLNSPKLSSLSSIKPYIEAQYKPILAGWLCSLVSVYSLSKSIPKIGTFSSSISKLSVTQLRNEGLVLGVFVLARLVATYWQQAFLWEAALSGVHDLRVNVFEKVLQRDLAFFEGGSGVLAGDIACRITSEANDVADAIYALLNTIVPSALQLSAMAMQMLVISPVLSMISAMAIPCMALVITYLGERLRKISKKSNLTMATLSSYLNEVLPAILFVKANNAELCESARFQRFAHSDLSERLKKKKMKALIPQIVQIIYFGALFILCAGSLLVSSGSFDACTMVSFITSLAFFIEPIQDIGKAYNELKQGEPAIERLFDLTKFKSKVIEKPDAVDLDYINGDVKFCDISFRYGDNMPLVLNKMNLHIRAGETVALVGPSGGGKTTLVKLLLRLYDPLSGRILIDNHNIQNIRLDNLRRHVGLVSQDITLFSGTVAENIGYRDLMRKIDMEKVELAARTANADEFIGKLPQGYETNIGPRGSRLSGGQRQRLAIARALYQDFSILILDEATSALDSRSELLVRQAVERLMENHTVFVIAHRLETVMMAKRVFLLNEGKLEELNRPTLFSSKYDSLGRAYFPGRRFDVMTTNLAESINSKLLIEKEFPIIALFDAIQRTLSRWFHERDTESDNFTTTLVLSAEKLLRECMELSNAPFAYPFNA